MGEYYRMNIRPGTSLTSIPGINRRSMMYGFIWACSLIFITIIWMTDTVPVIRSQFFVATPCVVKETLISDSSLRGHPKTHNVFLSFQVNGKEYSTWAYNLNYQLTEGRGAIDQWFKGIKEGQQLSCWYDPLYPNLVILKKPDIIEIITLIGIPWIIMMLAFGTLFFGMIKKL